MNGVQSDFERFYYMNEFYQNIGMQVMPNVTDFIEYAHSEGAFSENSDQFDLTSKSVLNFLSKTAQYGGCALLTLPTKLGLAKPSSNNQNSIEEVFKAYSYNDAAGKDDVESSFIVLYSNQKSSVLNQEDQSGENAYVTDGFDIADTWGKIVPQPMFSDTDNDGYVVPSFGVSFAKQNQSYFKRVRLSMEDHDVTEYSMRTMLMISYSNNRGPRESSIVGQNLYSVYANYSYSCTVDMMGDAQITPLMYFQLNNIPMWKGAYMITEVSHDISAGEMTTSFKGVRQARPTVPLKTDDIPQAADDAAKETLQSQNEQPGKPVGEPESASERRLDKIDVEKVRSIVLEIERKSYREKNKWVYGMLSAKVFYKDNAGTDRSEEDINNVALTIEPAVSPAQNQNKKIEELTPSEIKSMYALPLGRYSMVMVENADKNDEYRNPGNSFYKFTDGKHLTVSDYRLGYKRSEIITGETSFDQIDSGDAGKICFGGLGPIMLYESDGLTVAGDSDGKTRIEAVYREVFDLVRRMNEAKKPVTLQIINAKGFNG